MSSAAQFRIWLTYDGRHVPDGHPDATTLAYAVGDTVPKAVTDELEELAAAGQPPKRAERAPVTKAAAKPADKQQARRADK